MHQIVVAILCRLRHPFPQGELGYRQNPPFFCGKSYYFYRISCTNPLFDTEYHQAKVPPYNGNDPPPAPGSLKAFLFPPLLNEVQNKGTQGVQARCGAELPPFISIVRYPGRPVTVILGMELFSLTGKSGAKGGAKWWTSIGGSQKGGFQKGGFGGCSPAPRTGMRVHSDVPRHPKTATRVHANVPRHQKQERGHIRQNRPFTKPPFCFLSTQFCACLILSELASARPIWS